MIKQYLLHGNHDWLFERNPSLAKSIANKATVLIDEMIEVNGIKIYGSPMVPKFGNWAFMKQRGEEIKKYWDKIPEGVDILFTHGPPFGALDQNERGQHCGCEELLSAVKNRIKPKYHAYGHIHEAYGQIKIDGTTYINASICDERYRPINKPVVIEI